MFSTDAIIQIPKYVNKVTIKNSKTSSGHSELISISHKYSHMKNVTFVPSDLKGFFQLINSETMASVCVFEAIFKFIFSPNVN